MVSDLKTRQNRKIAKRKERIETETDRQRKWLEQMNRRWQCHDAASYAVNPQSLERAILDCLKATLEAEKIGAPLDDERLSPTPFTRLQEYLAHWPPDEHRKHQFAQLVGQLMVKAFTATKEKGQQHRAEFRKACKAVFEFNAPDQQRIKELIEWFLAGGINRPIKRPAPSAPAAPRPRATAPAPKAKPRKNRRSQCPKCGEFNSLATSTPKVHATLSTQYLKCQSCGEDWNRPKRQA